MTGDHESTAEASNPYRLLILGDGSVRTVLLRGERWVIGRAVDCEIPLRDPTVSRRHILLERRGDSFHFQDLGGVNPVLLDGRAAPHGHVAPGQTISIGLTRIILERRQRRASLTSTSLATVVLSREVVDEEVPASPDSDSYPSTAARVLERIEWTFADIGDLNDAAEPLLDLALNLTNRRSGFVGRLLADGGIETLAAIDLQCGSSTPELPATILDEIRRIKQPQLLTTREGEVTQSRLIVPLGNGPDGLVVLASPEVNAPEGQDVLRLAGSLGRVLWHRLLETTERLRLRGELQRMRFHGTVAHNALLAGTRLHSIRQSLRSLAGGHQPVLLIGEEGTEREELARYQHAESPRHKAAFVAWNPAQLPAAQHEKGLLAEQHHANGTLALARGGTLFIDHITSLSVDLQQRLTEKMRQVPAADEPTTLLVVAATVAPGHEASEWSPRLLEWIGPNVLTIPPLRTDTRDILALAELFLSEMGSCPDGSPRLLTERSKRILVAHGWHGNVRELRLVLESASAAAGNLPIAPRHLPAGLVNKAEPMVASIPTLEEVERRHIADVLRGTGGNRARAAQVLGIANSTLYDKLKRFDID